MVRWSVAAVALAVVLATLGGGSAEPAGRVGPEPREWDRVVEKGVGYLKAAQAEDGTWSRERSPGVTGIALTALLRSGKVTPQEPAAERALKYIESLINPQAGHIAGKDPRPQLQNYVTCVNLMALVEAGRDSYKPVIKDAARFLAKLQWDEGEGRNPGDDFYGGAGYDSKSRPDLSNSQFFLDALKAAGVPPDDPAYKRALVFVSRCQNLKGEHNDQAWAGKINDGSFVYSAAAGGQTKVQDAPNADGGLPGYGSMTYAGIKSLIYCGVARDDPRVQKALEYIRRNYTVEANPGMPKVRSQWGLYYYYHTMAKCLDALGLDHVEDVNGVKHDWRADVTAALARRQRPDGSWLNEQDRWMEGDPNLVTAYALMALSYCKPKK